MKTLFALATLLSMTVLAAAVNAGDFPKKVHYIDH